MRPDSKLRGGAQIHDSPISPQRMSIEFHVNENKLIEVLVWLAKAQPGIDEFHVSKVLYYADKDHLNRYGRPILGDTYIRMRHGPVPSLIYDVTKEAAASKPRIKKLRDILAKSVVIEGGFRHLRKHLREPNIDLFSKTDIQCLSASLEKYGTYEFGPLSRISHKEPAWQNAQENGTMAYEDMVTKGPKQQKILQHLKEYSRHIVL